MIHHESSFQLLAECPNGYIGECTCCQKFNVAYKSILLTFAEENLCAFFEWILTARYDYESYWPMPHGRERVFTSPFSNLYLTFREDELDELAELYARTQLILEARNLVKRN